MVTEQNTRESEQLRASQVFLEYHLYVRRIAFQVAPSDVLLDDIVNDVYVEFVSHPTRWNYTKDLRPLFKRMARNIGLQYWRRHLQKLPEALKRIALNIQKRSDSEQIDEEPQFDIELRAMEICLGKLTVEQRDLLEVHYYQGVSLVEMARNDSKNVNTLYSLLSRLRDALRRCIQKIIQNGECHVQ